MRSVILMTIVFGMWCSFWIHYFPDQNFFFYISSDCDVDREILNAKLLNIFLPFDSTTLNVCHNTRPAGLIQENTIEQKNYRITCCKEMRNRNTDCMNTKRNFM